jgi:hypothetical protein
VSEFNLPLLRKAVEWAESEARKPEAESEWFQGWFVSRGEHVSRSCETAYCIAGYAVYISDFNVEQVGSPDESARELLGIDWDDAWNRGLGFGLFAASNTIEDVRRIAGNIAKKYGEEL